MDFIKSNCFPEGAAPPQAASFRMRKTVSEDCVLENMFDDSGKKKHYVEDGMYQLEFDFDG